MNHIVLFKCGSKDLDCKVVIKENGGIYFTILGILYLVQTYFDVLTSLFTSRS